MDYNSSDYFDPIPAPENHFTPSRIISYVLLGVFIVISVVGLWNYFLGPTTPPKAVLSTTSVPVNNFPGKIAFIRDYNVWVRVNDVEKQITNDAKVSLKKSTPIYQVTYSYPVISPDGKKVAFFQSKAGIYRLYVSAIDGNNKQLISGSDAFEATYPVQWLKDSKNVYIETNPGAEYHLVKLDTTNGDQQVIASYPISTGCGGTLIDPARVLGARDNALPIYSKIFQISPDEKYLIHNTSCTGYGVSELEIATKKSLPISKVITQVTYSSDGTKIAGISEDKKIYIYEAKTAKVFKIISTSEQPQSIFLSPDGKTLYYIWNNVVKTKKVTDTLGNLLNAKEYASSIVAVTLNTGEERRIHTFAMNSVRIVSVSPDGNEFLLSQIENPAKYYEAMEKKTQDFSGVYPQAYLIRFSYLTGKISTVSEKALEAYYR